MSEKGTKRLVAEQIGAMFGRLADLINGNLFLRLGWYADQLPPAYQTVATAASALASAADALAAAGTIDNETLVEQVLANATSVYGSLRDLTAPSGVDAAVFAAEFFDRVVAMVVTDHLSAELPTLYQALVLLGVIVEDFQPSVPDGPGQVARPMSVNRRIDYDVLADIVSKPGSIPKEAQGWGTSAFRFERMASPLVELLNAAGLTASIEAVDPDLQAALQPTAQPDQALTRIARISFFEGLVADVPVDLAITLLDAPADGTHPLPGFVVHPRFPQLQDSVALGPNTTMTVEGGLALSQSFALFIRPEQTPELRFPFANGSVPAGGVALRLKFAPPQPSVLLGRQSATRVQVTGVNVAAFVGNNSGKFEVAGEVRPVGLKLVVVPGDADSFLGSLLGGTPFEVDIDAGARWSNVTGLSFVGSGRFEVVLASNKSVGPLQIHQLKLAVLGGVEEGAPTLRAQVSADLGLALGPITAEAQDLGAQLILHVRQGNAGPFDVDIGFKAPTGVGIRIAAGAVTGGGFLSFDTEHGRYSGALELSIYSVAVKAFGLVETKLPDGKPGFSFVIVISAEFTPIQLGLGFTLLGVGGLIGINRTVNGSALADLVRSGHAGNLLFPTNVAANAPAIIRDLGAVFPARVGHYVFGPLAKLGWGTPTLIRAELGLILELPGPVLSLLGEVQSILPKPETPLVKLNMSIGGMLDFPRRMFALDAALHDSIINGFPVSGQMAMRLRWGEQPNFALSIGGFHPAFQPPPEFPKLQPLAVDLSQGGNPTITVSGFFAITSNTLQIGGDARLHAGGSGISLDASVSVKALFVFTPFSFEARIDASVRISFHGHGPSVHLSGLLSGPSPWRVKGEVCVSILFWDACLRFEKTFGGREEVSQPELDPWFGSAGSPEVLGLKSALEEPRNWSAQPPPGAFAVVSVGAGADKLVDPLGGFSVRQKVAPLETKQPIKRFGPAKAKPITFKLPVLGAVLQVNPAVPGTDVPLSRLGDPKDFFAGAQFFEMNDAKKLSAPAFEPYQAGYVLGANPNNLQLGSNAPKSLAYDTVFLSPDSALAGAGPYGVSAPHLEAFTKKSAAARFGFAQQGTLRFVDPARPQAFEVRAPAFVLATTSLARVTPAGETFTRSEALLALDAHLAANPADHGQVQVLPVHELGAA